MPVQCICAVCETPYVVRPSALGTGRNGQFCSRACFAQARRETRICATCLYCGKPVFILPLRQAAGEGKYCSTSCYHQHRQQLATERFWSQVLKTETCWLWQGNRSSKGYGRFGVGYDRIAAHRFAYQLTYGLILPGLFCCHHCDTRLCVRPEHLFLGTQRDNMRDMSSKGRSGAHAHPETLARGERNGSHTHPEKIRRGAQSPTAKLTDEKVRTMRYLRATEQWTWARLAAHFGVSLTLVRKVVIREMWRHVS